jgi:hypothetical protein
MTPGDNVGGGEVGNAYTALWRRDAVVVFPTLEVGEG